MDHPSNDPGPSAIGLVIIDDDLFVRTTLTNELGAAHDICIKGAYASGMSAIADIGTTRPDLALVDIMMPGLDGVETTRQLGLVSPSTRVLALTSVTDPAQAAAMLHAGAVGFIPKDLAMRGILDTIRAAHHGVAVLAGAAIDLINTNSAQNLASTLTPAERQIASLIRQGKTNQQIAELTFTSPSTVKNHLLSTMRKMGAHNRVALAIKAHEANL